MFAHQALEEEGSKAGLVVEMVHRKINLQEDTQAWEHEKYSMRRLPAFTLSRLQVCVDSPLLLPLLLYCRNSLTCVLFMVNYDVFLLSSEVIVLQEPSYLWFFGEEFCGKIVMCLYFVLIVKKTNTGNMWKSYVWIRVKVVLMCSGTQDWRARQHPGHTGHHWRGGADQEHWGSRLSAAEAHLQHLCGWHLWQWPGESYWKIDRQVGMRVTLVHFTLQNTLYIFLSSYLCLSWLHHIVNNSRLVHFLSSRHYQLFTQQASRTWHACFLLSRYYLAFT